MSRHAACLGCVVLLACVLLGGCAPRQKAIEAPVELTWYLKTGTADRFNGMKGILEIEKRTGVDIQFVPPPANSDDAYFMMVASGNLPDIIMWNHSPGIDRLYQEGLVLELNDLIAEHAPNLTKLYTERSELRREVETADGKIYYFPCINPMQTLDEICRRCYVGFIIRGDWLEKLGLSAPNTMDEWYNVLSAFKKRDPNGNGLSDEIPFDGGNLPYFAPAFGVLNTFCVKEDGAVVYGPMEPEYKKFLETMNKWYMEGLLGSNSIIVSSKWADENIQNDLTGAFVGLDNAWRYHLPALCEKAPNAEFVALPWLMNADGVRYTPWEYMAGHMSSIVTVITSSCQNPEAAVRAIDYMYSPEGSDLLTWGIEGETYEIVNGKKQLTPNALLKAEDGQFVLYHYATAHASFPKYDGETAVLATYPEDQRIAEKIWSNAVTDLIYPPAIKMSVEDMTLCNELMESITHYYAEMEIKFITGEEPFTNFDTFVANLRRMRIDDVLAVYRRQYEKYMNR